MPQAALVAEDAQTMQAVPNMLEIIPRGVNKVQAPQVCVRGERTAVCAVFARLVRLPLFVCIMGDVPRASSQQTPSFCASTSMQWVGMQRLLTDMDLPRDAVMAVGDGGNDYELVSNCGLGVAMANAVPKVGTPWYSAADVFAIAEQPSCHDCRCAIRLHALSKCRCNKGFGAGCLCRCWSVRTMSRRQTTTMASRRHWRDLCCEDCLRTQRQISSNKALPDCRSVGYRQCARQDWRQSRRFAMRYSGISQNTGPPSVLVADRRW